MNTRICEYDAMCLSNWLKNTQKNVKNWLVVAAEIEDSNFDMAKLLFANLVNEFPFRLWEVTVSDKVKDSTISDVKCIDCFNFTDYNGTYNVDVSSLANDTVANLTITTNTDIFANVSHYAGTADDAVKYIWDTYCVSGVNVISLDNR